MKWTSTLLVFGGIAAIGVVSYLIYNQLHRPEIDNSDPVNIQLDSENDLNAHSCSREDLHTEANFSVQKQSTAKNIYERHNEAGKVFNEILDNISNYTNHSAETITKNSEQLNEIDNNLDDLLN